MKADDRKQNCRKVSSGHLYFGFRFNVNKIFNKILSEGPFSCFSSI